MYSYINPEVVLINEPKGIDLAIQRVQVYLGNISFIQKVFGRATIQNKTVKVAGQTRETEMKFPEVWGKNMEPMNVMPNDNLASYCFFIAHDTADYEDHDILDKQIAIAQDVSLIFWGQLDKLDDTKDDRYSENIKLQILDVLKRVPNFKLSRHYEEYDNVFREFTISDDYKRYLKPPYYALRITGTMYYKMFEENVCQSQSTIFPLPDFVQSRIDTLMEDYAPKVLDFEVGTDIETGTEVAILRQYGFGDQDQPLALSEVEILGVTWQNTPLQDIAKADNNTKLDFSVVGGVYDGKVTILFRKKIA